MEKCIVCGRFASEWEPMPSGRGKFNGTAHHCGQHSIESVRKAWLEKVKEEDELLGVADECDED